MDDVRLFILMLVLLVVAVILGVLTLWYWKYTDPRNKSSYSQARRGPNQRPRQVQRRPVNSQRPSNGRRAPQQYREDPNMRGRSGRSGREQGKVHPGYMAEQEQRNIRFGGSAMMDPSERNRDRHG